MNLILRLNSWWKKLIGFLLIIYLNFDLNYGINNNYKILFTIISGLIIGAVWTSFVNDYYDLEIDKKAGKQTYLSKFKKPDVWIFLLFSSVLILIYILLNIESTIAKIYYLCAMICVFAYSSKFFRYKEIAGLDILFDALGTQFFPALFCFSFFDTDLFSQLTGALWLFFSQGVRALIIHQNRDKEKDQKVGLKTFVISGYLERFASFFIVAEVLLFFLFISNFGLIYTLIFFVLFIIYQSKVSYTYFTLPEKSGQRIFMYDFYFLVPIIVLMRLCTENYTVFCVLFIHIFLFHFHQVRSIIFK